MLVNELLHSATAWGKVPGTIALAELMVAVGMDVIIGSGGADNGLHDLNSFGAAIEVPKFAGLEESCT